MDEHPPKRFGYGSLTSSSRDAIGAQSSIDNVPAEAATSLLSGDNSSHTSYGGGRASMRQSLLRIPEQFRSFALKVRQLEPNEQQELAKACRMIAEDQGFTRKSTFLWQPQPSQLAKSTRTEGADDVPDIPKKRWGIHRVGLTHLYIYRAGAPVYIHLPSALAYALVIAGLWVALWASFGKPLEPHGAIFDAFFTVLFSGVVGGLGCWMLQLPPLVGIMWAAVLYKHLPGDPASGITSTVTSPFKNMALAIILLRGGISLNLKTIRPILVNVLLLGVIPMFLEATVTGMLAQSLFNYDTDSTLWAYLHGFTTAPLSASVIVSSCLYLQTIGRGSTGGPTVLMLSAVGMDSSLGIWGSTFLQSLVFAAADKDPTVSAILAPVQVIAGVALGVGGGYAVFHLTSSFYKAHSRVDGHADFDRAVNLLSFGIIFFFACATIFLSKKYEMEGGGALAVVSFGATLNNNWLSLFALQPEASKRKTAFAETIAVVWDIIGMPSVFAFVGVGMDLKSVFNVDFLQHAITIWSCGCAVRMLFALIATWGTDYSRRERAVLALGWIGKATAQATLGGMVYDRALTLLQSATTPEDIAKYTEWERRGKMISNMSVVAIMLGAPLSSLVIRKLGAKWVRTDYNVFDGQPLSSTQNGGVEGDHEEHSMQTLVTR